MSWLTKLNIRNADIVERHVHSPHLIYGNNINYMGLNVPIKFTVTGGDNDWGTQLLITAGTTIESGDPLKYFDLNSMYVVSASEANEVTVVDFMYGTIMGPEVTTVVTDDSEDNFTKAGHGVVNGDTIIITNLATTTGLVSYQVYYVVNMSGNVFQLAYTAGGTPIVLGTGDGTCSFKKLTLSSLTSTVVSMAATTSDSTPVHFNCPRIPCNSYLTVRAKSNTGHTVGIGFLLGLHTYPEI